MRFAGTEWNPRACPCHGGSPSLLEPLGPMAQNTRSATTRRWVRVWEAPGAAFPVAVCPLPIVFLFTIFSQQKSFFLNISAGLLSGLAGWSFFLAPAHCGLPCSSSFPQVSLHHWPSSPSSPLFLVFTVDKEFSLRADPDFMYPNRRHTIYNP